MKRNFNSGNISDDGDCDLSNKHNSQNDSDNALDYSAASDHSSTDSGTFAQQHSNSSSTSAVPTNAKHSRSNNHGTKNFEEDERRRIRRERNKMAAAKCRQKRVDQTNSLLEETKKLEAVQQKLKEEIQNYEKQKEELEFIMDSHLLYCNMKPKYSASNTRKTSNTLALDNEDDLRTDASMQVKSEDDETLLKVDINSKRPNFISDNNPTLALKSENGKQFLILPCNNVLSESFNNNSNDCSVVANSLLSESARNVTSTPDTHIINPTNSNNNLLDARLINEFLQQQQDQLQQLQQKLASSRPLTAVRPNYLPTQTSHSALMMTSSSVNTTSATTPTFLAIGLDSIIDGQAALTPISGFSPFAGQPSQLLITPVMSLPLDNVLSAIRTNDTENNASCGSNNNNNNNNNKESFVTALTPIKSEKMDH